MLYLLCSSHCSKCFIRLIHLTIKTHTHTHSLSRYYHNPHVTNGSTIGWKVCKWLDQVDMRLGLLPKLGTVSVSYLLYYTISSMQNMIFRGTVFQASLCNRLACSFLPNIRFILNASFISEMIHIQF